MARINSGEKCDMSPPALVMALAAPAQFTLVRLGSGALYWPDLHDRVCGNEDFGSFDQAA